MQDVTYKKAATVDEAVKLLQEGGPTARVLAGGTDIIVMARERRREVHTFVDIKAIQETMDYHFDPSSGLTLGAATPCYRIYGDETIKKNYPALVEAASVIGGVAIQGRASLGGNLCNSGPAADSVPAMIVLGGVANVAGPGGRRQVPLADFCTGPSTNVLAPGEFVVTLQFPAPPANSGAAWQRFIPRNEMDIAVVNAASFLRFEGANVAEARIAIGAVAPKCLTVPDAVAALVGKPLTDETIKAAAEAAKATARPIDDMRGSVKQRKHLTAVLVERTLREAARRALGG
uniref:Putative FAD binding domain in molybdopterin dehydrogenase n=1 Tax=uncultured bacterium 5G4 TaxID=1701326 RepID=A0A166H3B5_9BACT|nr:putative FAD binding domain in molybdopterin dehydrogenase [uncultured bacterium 5G4]